ncbi:hypothetical protein DSECCO2_427660 [anaerobic digester metagenome]
MNSQESLIGILFWDKCDFCDMSHLSQKSHKSIKLFLLAPSAKCSIATTKVFCFEFMHFRIFDV